MKSNETSFDYQVWLITEIKYIKWFWSKSTKKQTVTKKFYFSRESIFFSFFTLFERKALYFRKKFGVTPKDISKRGFFHFLLYVYNNIKKKINIHFFLYLWVGYFLNHKWLKHMTCSWLVVILNSLNATLMCAE